MLPATKVNMGMAQVASVPMTAAASVRLKLRNASNQKRKPAPTRQALRILRTTCPWKRSEEHTSELQSLMRISYAVFCLKKKKKKKNDKCVLRKAKKIETGNKQSCAQ